MFAGERNRPVVSRSDCPPPSSGAFLRYSLVPTLALTLVASVSRSRVPLHELPTLAPNPNTTPAGTLANGVLSLDLETVHARWHREGGAVPGTPVDAFAEAGKGPSIPGPLVRVPAGTQLHVRVHNTLSHRVTYFLPTSPTTDDSIVVQPGATGEITARADKPGNFIYRATDTTKAAAQLRMAGAMGGAVIVDTAGAHPRDHVFVILMVPDSALVAVADTGTLIGSPGGRISFTMNGLSWPNTERVKTTVGDTLHWRVINASADIHPMHLHGFYFRVDELTGLLVEHDGQGAPGRMVVTERLTDYSAMNMTWTPERPGNWVFHCHFALHVMPPMADPADPMPMDRGNHALTGMVGLVIGLDVAPRRGVTLAGDVTPTRHIRLVAVRDSEFADPAAEERFVIEENGRHTGARIPFSPTLYLTRNEPVAITVVNHLPERTAVHWHGLEIESYYDGVAGLSGTATHLAPTIAPGDSFVAHLTPPRAGTFMYHSHVNDANQQTAGLVGALIVRDGPPGPRPNEFEFFLKGSRDINAGAKTPLDINGSTNPDTIVLHVGQPARLRFMSLALVDPEATITLTARRDSSSANLGDTLLMRWTPVAKDGADLPASARTSRIARQIMAMGETYDFSFTPTRRGMLRIEVRDEDPKGALLARVPIRVE